MYDAPTAGLTVEAHKALKRKQPFRDKGSTTNAMDIANRIRQKSVGFSVEKSRSDLYM
jgi:hypothetical protein